MQKQVEIGYNLYNERKFKEAYDTLIDEAIYNNNGDAQYLIGKMYHDGDGVEQNVETAMRWWKKARQNGQKDAAFAFSSIQTSTKNMF